MSLSSAASRLIFNLSSSFYYIINSLWFRHFFRFELHLIPSVAELTSPYLLLFLFVLLYCAVHVEDSLTRSTKDRISSGEFTLILEAAHGDLENVSVHFLPVFLSFFFLLAWHLVVLRIDKGVSSVEVILALATYWQGVLQNLWLSTEKLLRGWLNHGRTRHGKHAILLLLLVLHLLLRLSHRESRLWNLFRISLLLRFLLRLFSSKRWNQPSKEPLFLLRLLIVILLLNRTQLHLLLRHAQIIF